ncbi:Na+/H+ antiporter subunit E [soil metagenome]
MKRIFPAPLLSVALFALWMILNPTPSAGQFLLALLVAVVGPLATVSLRPVPVRIRRPRVLLRLLAHVLADVFSSNKAVFIAVFRSDRIEPTGTFVKVPLALHDPNGLAALAIIMCITPGTIWTELSLDRSVLLLHVFNLGSGPTDEAEFIARIKSRYEQPLIEIFE